MTSTAADDLRTNVIGAWTAAILRKPQHRRIQRDLPPGRRRRGNHHVHSRRLHVGPADEVGRSQIQPATTSSGRTDDELAAAASGYLSYSAPTASSATT